ncbi:hypothetical protein KXJ69_01890 [Aureisphaera sp. CAU 1614]|jgi:hypothetical protein|uniref:Uncharacterized protein n=1 Tax=Halomarinibacterium sedimenti TaxID=2857106 RepID=A0A9X1FNE0_9FLAO|nr:hypothetical protein [Halomarinibacterium sedimenti]MAL58780.1 hypothetical protein [Flavobacteriaceae bacterium]MBW2936837.1 hypothetical protein [Halomarinibacterium sedimenti]HAT65247.1 hypothetical protein [Flavobacteriaceae bacterium]|tara:strand:- start:589 stop:876 length:288 start_codon:yes stop_codon:yes gene_type:complete
MKKEIFIGFLVGIISNTLGVIVCTFIVAQLKNQEFVHTFNLYLNSQNLWMLLTLGALPNLAAFFGFLKINREYRARGVLLATFVTAITAYLIYFL